MSPTVGTRVFQAGGKILRRLHALAALYAGLAGLGLGCLAWTVVALPLNLLLPRRGRVWLGRRIATLGFRLYLACLQAVGVGRFDLRALDALRYDGPLIIAPNHPGMLDALMVISRLPNVACVLKASLLENPFWGAGSRLAGYIRNDWFIGSVNLAAEELGRGGQLLLFPEGTRSGNAVLGEFRAGPAYLSYRTGVAIQTVFIEQDSRFLSKGWPLFRRPDLPMHFRIRLGRRFQPPADPKAFTRELRDYFQRELAGRANPC